MKKNLNYLGLGKKSFGYKRREELLGEVLKGGTFLPNTVTYEDIDKDFRRWVVEDLKLLSDEGVEFPTMSLYSNQRFSEYTQTWRHVDSNNNLILNFKTVSRESNPTYGKIQNGLWNIPTDEFFLMKRSIVLDDNGSESFLDLKMKQPVAIDFTFNVSVFATKFQYINEFNTKLNKLFSARQCYLNPNGYYMPMTLEGVSDNSSYNIDDRQFYSQTATIKLNGFVITEDDFRLEEKPIKIRMGVGFQKGCVRKRKPITEIEEYEPIEVATKDECGNDKTVIVKIKTGKKIPIPIEDLDEEEGRYYYRPVILTIHFKELSNVAEFTLDTDFNLLDAEFDNLHNHFEIRNQEGDTKKFRKGDEIYIKVFILNTQLPSTLTLYGYCPSEVFDVRKDETEIPQQDTQFAFEQGILCDCECECDIE